jgi:diguanylate cyclase (GGDEF)-like protein
MVYQAWMNRDALLASLLEIALLAFGAALAAWIARRSVRLALAFVLVAIVVGPPPAGLIVAFAATLGGLGGGVSGIRLRGIAPVVALGMGVAVAESLHALGGTQIVPGTLAALLNFIVLFALIQTVSVSLGLLLVRSTPGPLLANERLSREITVLAIEAVNIPVAWVLGALLADEGVLPPLVMAALILLGAFSLRKLDRVVGDLRDTNDSLAARVTELDTLHSIGREIQSSLDPGRVFAIIERECRKIFDLDLLFIALVDRETRDLRLVYHRRKDNAGEWLDRPLGEGVASWVVAEKRAIRVDELTLDDNRERFGRGPEEMEIRSLLAVPLIVEDEVIGVLSVQSGSVAAYDDHQLSVLTTIAQQGAVAIENARNYAMATVDSLTGLYLRDYFFQRLREEHNRAIRYRGTFAVLMMDLDGFKEINDTHGHYTGDRYLKELGATIRGRLRAADLACRYGGDEFCLLLPETDLEGARVIAERIRADVANLIVKGDALAIRTTVSIGVAVFPDHDTDDLNILVRMADEALYRAKRQGRDRVVPFAA